MLVISTIGPDNATKAVLPFIAGKGAVSNGEKVDVFLMQEATFLGSENHSVLEELKAPGLPTVEDVLAAIQDNIGEFIVCKPCATSRGVSEDDLRGLAEFGGSTDLARLAQENDSTVTF